MKVDKAATKKARERQEAGIATLREAFKWTPQSVPANCQNGRKR